MGFLESPRQLATDLLRRRNSWLDTLCAVLQAMKYVLLPFLSFCVAWWFVSAGGPKRPIAQVNRRRSAKRGGYQHWPWPVLASALNVQLGCGAQWKYVENTPRLMTLSKLANTTFKMLHLRWYAIPFPVEPQFVIGVRNLLLCQRTFPQRIFYCFGVCARFFEH